MRHIPRKKMLLNLSKVFCHHVDFLLCFKNTNRGIILLNFHQPILSASWIHQIFLLSDTVKYYKSFKLPRATPGQSLQCLQSYLCWACSVHFLQSDLSLVTIIQLFWLRNAMSFLKAPANKQSVCKQHSDLIQMSA